MRPQKSDLLLLQVPSYCRAQMNLRGKSQPAQKRVYRRVAPRQPSGGRELFLFSKRVVLDSCFLHWLALALLLFLYSQVAVNRWPVCR